MIWKVAGSGHHPCATSVVSVGKCCHEVLSSSGSIPVSFYQLRSVKVRAWASIFGQYRSSRHRMDPTAAAVAASWFWMVLWQHGLEWRVPWGFLILCLSDRDRGRSFLGVLFCGVALGSLLEAQPKARCCNLQQFCKHLIPCINSLLLKIAWVVSVFCKWILTDRGSTTVVFYFLKKLWSKCSSMLTF